MLHNGKKRWKSRDITMVMGDLKTKIGCESDDDIVGKFLLGTHNEHGEKRVTVNDHGQANNEDVYGHDEFQ